MAIQFPDNPTSQSPINTFSPISSPDVNTVNDYTYTFVPIGASGNGYWTSFVSGSGNGTTRGGGDNLVFQENEMICSEDYVITPTWSAVSAGPITIEDGTVITIPDNQSWVIL